MEKKKNIYLPLFFACIICSFINAKAQQVQQITPEVILEVEDNRYIVHFALPAYSIINDDGYDYDVEYGYDSNPSPCGEFSVIDMDADYDKTDISGYPELPFFSINLIVPNSTEYEITFVPGQTEDIYLDHYIEAAIDDSVIVDDSSCYNTEYYDNGVDEEYPYGFYRNFYEISDRYNISDAEGVTLSIHPFAYYPHQDHIEVLLNGTFYIEFETDDLIDVINDFNYETYNLPIWLYFDNYNNETNLPDFIDRGNYLIIASHSNMRQSLSNYVEYKINQGYNVNVLYLNEHNATGNVENIYDLINNNNLIEHPDFVLLVGSLDDIPPYEGGNYYTDPFSDEGYHQNVGRWIVSPIYNGYPELLNLTFKAMLCENQYTITDEEAILFSGKVGNKRLGKKLYEHIKKIKNISFDKIDIPASLYDGRNPNIGFDDMNEALQNDPKFFIYSGEGAVIHDNSNSAILTTGISNPYIIIPNNFSCNEIPFNHIGDINNYSATIFPMSFGFSCKLNTFCTNKNFGAEWIGNINGGVTFYGSTTDTKFTPNLRLSKKIFKKLKQFINKKDNFPISTWLYCSEQAYYNALMTSVRRNQIKRYNLLGDPTLHINGISSNTEENIYYSSQSKKVSDKDNININIKIKQIYVYDITGRLINIYIDKNIDDILSNISKGIYLVKILYTNDTIETIKFIN